MSFSTFLTATSCLVLVGMATIFEDVFDVKAVNKEGKKFEKGTMKQECQVATPYNHAL